MSEDFNKYLAIANHDIQVANNIGELKSYVASILYDNDKKIDMIQELERENKRLNKIINELEKGLNQTIQNSSVKPHVEMAIYILKELKELKGSDKE